MNTKEVYKMVLSPEDKAAISIVMSTLLPEEGIKTLDLSETYLLRERVALVQAEVEFYRVQVDNHLSELNSKVQSRSPRKEVSNDLISKIAQALGKGNVDIANLLASINE
jgi:hypothetical protein